MEKRLRIHLLIVIAGAWVVGFSCSTSLSVPGSDSTKKMETAGPFADLVNEDETADQFHFSEKEMVLALMADNSLHREQHPAISDKDAKITKSVVAKENLPGVLKRFTDDVDPDKRIVYLKVDANSAYENVLQVMELVRKADIDRVGLVTANENRSEYFNAVGFEIRLPAPLMDEKILVKPNPLTLVVGLSRDGRLSLNHQDHETLLRPQSLENRLKDIFIVRNDNAVFREGTVEIEKTVYIRAPKSVKHIDVLKLIRSVKRAGSDRIVIQMDDLEYWDK